MTDAPRFVIDGASYPIPDRDSFSIGEYRIYHEWTGMHMEDIDDTRVNSFVVGAFMQVAYMRANPGINPQVAQQAVENSNYVEQIKELAKAEEDDVRPPELTKSEHDQSGSPHETRSSPSTSGDDSTTHSDGLASVRTDGGTPPSAIHVTSGQTRSAA